MVDAGGTDEQRDALDAPDDAGEERAQAAPVIDVGRRICVIACGAFATVMVIAATVLVTLHLTRDTLRYLPTLAANHLFMVIAASLLAVSAAAMLATTMLLADGLSVWSRIGRCVRLVAIFAALIGLQAWCFGYHDFVWWLLVLGGPAGFAALCVRDCRPAQS